MATDSNIQGNVLAGFNKDHQTLLFVHFPDQATGRAWLTELQPRLASNAAVAAFNDRFKKKRRASGRDPEDMFALWTNISFTAAGITLLDPAATTGLTTHGAPDAGIQVWLQGAADPDLLIAIGDGPTNGWFFGKADVELHAVVCVAADRPSDLELELTRHRERATPHGVVILFEQPGATLPGVAAGHEHFGFKDGISQPGVSGFDLPSESDPTQVAGRLGADLIAAGSFVLGYPTDEGQAVPVPRWMFDGSFLVTRRLAQDVPGFWAEVETRHAELPEAVRTDPTTGIPSPDALAARLVGRWRSGTPTGHAPVADNRSAQDPANDNDFDFATDPDGIHTPACAHIRKVYPRSGALTAQIPVSEADTKKRRIMRRGIPFGLPFQPTAGRGEGVDATRGLLFQCYQSNLNDQFVFLQQAWINSPDFPADGTGKDPIIGTGSVVSLPAGGQGTVIQFNAFVRTEGSVFTFTPSLPTVAALAAGEPLATT